MGISVQQYRSLQRDGRIKVSSPSERTVDNIVFASKMEAHRYRQLKILERATKITNLTLQPKYEIQPEFNYRGRTIKAINYVADFKYYDLEKKYWIIEDVKGFETEVFKLKHKMFKYRYRDLELTIV